MAAPRATSLHHDLDDPKRAALAGGCDFQFLSRFWKQLRDFWQLQGDGAELQGSIRKYKYVALEDGEVGVASRKSQIPGK